MSHSELSLMTVREVAECLGMTRAGIYKWIKEGRMPQPMRLGGSKGVLRWRVCDIEQWLEDCKDD